MTLKGVEIAKAHRQHVAASSSKLILIAIVDGLRGFPEAIEVIYRRPGLYTQNS